MSEWVHDELQSACSQICDYFWSFEMDKVKLRNIGDIILRILSPCSLSVSVSLFLGPVLSCGWLSGLTADDIGRHWRATDDGRAIIADKLSSALLLSFIVLPCYLSILFESLTICFAVLSRFSTTSDRCDRHDAKYGVALTPNWKTSFVISFNPILMGAATTPQTQPRPRTQWMDGWMKSNAMRSYTFYGRI